MKEKRLTVHVHAVPAGYELSFRLPSEIYFTEALRHGFKTTGNDAQVLIDSSTLFIGAGQDDWLIHHEDQARSDPEKILGRIEDALGRWFGRLGYSLEFQRI